MSELTAAKCRNCHTDITYDHDSQAQRFKSEHPGETPVVICDDCAEEIKENRDAPADCDCGYNPPHPARQHRYVFEALAGNPHQKYVISGGIVEAVSDGLFKAELGEMGLEQ